MIINTSELNSSDWSDKILASITEKYGTIIDIPIPKNYFDLEKTAENYFFRISASFDSCANTPKDNIVIIDADSPLKEKIIEFLQMSKIEIISKKNIGF